jgi:sugar O-acyltransferase (sialic acid O-acetyltransferase NeuD family)
MSAGPLVVIGSGGQAKVVCDILLAMGETVDGFVDDEPSRVGLVVLGLPVLGTSSWLDGKNARVALGVGHNERRAEVARAVRARGARVVTCIHPSAVISASASIGEGTVVMANASVNPAAVVGEGCIVNTGAVVEHDNVLGEYVHLSPRVALGGEVKIGAFTHLGVGVSVHPRVTIGERTIVGVGAAVVRDLPSGIVAVGVPARERRKV